MSRRVVMGNITVPFSCEVDEGVKDPETYVIDQFDDRPMDFIEQWVTGETLQRQDISIEGSGNAED